MVNTVFYEPDTLKEFAIDVLIKAGVKLDNAEKVADTLICADLRGVSSHGIIRLPTYVQRIEAGVLNPNAETVLEKKGKSVALLNANNGFGQVAGYKAMHTAMKFAGVYGTGMVGVKDSNHFGIASYYSMMALEKDMIGIVLTHSSPAIAPYGTARPLLGTNPLSVAVPACKEKPIVLDMSMSVVARGKIRYAAMTNSKIPLNWALDEEGNPTDNPQKALKGSLVPIGGVKGSGLALVVDILCGVLTGNSLTGEVKNITDMSGPSKTGHIFCAINISDFVNIIEFKNNIDFIINKIKSLPSAENNPVYLPGEIEYNLADKRMKEGIPIDESVIETLNSLANRYGISNL